MSAAVLSATESVVADLLAHVREHSPGLVVTGLIAAGGAAPVLTAAAGRAALLVVGSHGRSGLASVLLGATSLHLATQAPVPVVVVHGSGEPRSGPVVVGADCSAGDGAAIGAAIGAAFAEAAGRGCSVTAVHGYRVPVPPRMRDAPSHDYDPAALRDDAFAALADAVAPWWTRYPNVDAELVVTPADPAEVLVARSRRARLIVVGTRGRGGVTGLLHGSVGQKLLHRADCPVLISRP
jgi:nucleotide-binding universal stress UspA family protein